MTTGIGRNGYVYDATHLSDKLFVVGKFIVRVVDGKCVTTVCKATKANIARILGRSAKTVTIDSVGDVAD